MYPGAGFYGINDILMRYARLPVIFPLPVAVQHGWQRFATSFESSASPPEIWVWSERIAQEYERYFPKKKIRITGSFFCYFLAQEENHRLAEQRKGSIVVVPHSSHFTKSKYSIDLYAEMLSGLTDDYKPITVMIYYLDMDDRIVATYRRYGFDVVCNGSLFDNKFLYNFVKHMRNKKYCIYNKLGSAPFYAAHMGVEPVFFGPEVEFENLGNVHITHEMADGGHEREAQFIKGLSREVIERELGVCHRLSPDSLREIVLSNYKPRAILKLSRDYISAKLRSLLGRKAIE